MGGHKKLRCSLKYGTKRRRKCDTKRCEFTGCDAIVSMPGGWRHNCKHATELGLVVHYAYDAGRPFCGAKKPRNRRGLNLCVVTETFTCPKCRQALNKWQDGRSDRIDTVRANLKQAIAEPGFAQGKRLLAVLDAAGHLLNVQDFVRELPVAVAKLRTAYEEARKHDPRRHVIAGEEGEGPLRPQ